MLQGTNWKHPLIISCDAENSFSSQSLKKPGQNESTQWASSIQNRPASLVSDRCLSKNSSILMGSIEFLISNMKCGRKSRPRKRKGVCGRGERRGTTYKWLSGCNLCRAFWIVENCYILNIFYPVWWNTLHVNLNIWKSFKNISKHTSTF
jgi:hypothetical protein